MKVTDGFSMANSTNLPKLDNFMLLQYMMESDKYNVAEIRGAKAFLSTRERYIDTAIGYVEIKRENMVCFVKAKVTPEHKVKSKLYAVSLEINEAQEKIVEARCHDCAASEGGCKHVLCFIMWLVKQTDMPAVTSVQCYWKKPKLREAVMQEKFISVESMSMTKRKSNIHTSKPPPSVTDLFNECKKRKLSGSMFTNNFALESSSDLNNLYVFNIILDLKLNGGEINYQNFLKLGSEKLTEQVKNKIEKKTRQQANSKLWHNLRQGRVTASIAYEVSKCQTESGVLVQKILGGYKTLETMAIRRGKILEEQVIHSVENMLDVKIKKCGFILISPIAGVSPDGLAEDFVVEVKCPSTDKSIKNYVKNNIVCPKFKAQIQLQMLATDKKRGLFCVADPNFENNKEVSMYWLDYDKNYVENLLQECEDFWVKNIFPKIVESVI